MAFPSWLMGYIPVRLLAMLDEYNFLRQEKDEEKRRLRVCVKHLTTSKSKIIANSLQHVMYPE
jgi:hypothetical protein